MFSIQTDTKKLIKALVLLKPLTGTSGRPSVLSNFRMEAKKSADDSVELWATDFVTELGFRIPATVTGPGVVLLPCASLIKMLRTFPKGELTILQEGETILIESGSFKTTLPVIDPGTYPGATKNLPPYRFTMDAPGMCRAMDLTVSFSSKSEDRKNLMGVHVTQDTGWSTWTATDGHRLGRVLQEVESKEAEKSEALIPRQALTVWRAALKWEGERGAVSIHYHEGNKRFAFITGSMTMTGRLIEGKFAEVDSL